MGRKRKPEEYQAEVKRATRHLAEAIKLLSDCKPDDAFAVSATVDEIIVAIMALGPNAQRQVEDYLED